MCERMDIHVRLKKQLNNKSGASLIELMVSCVLLIMLMTGIASLLPSALSVYQKVRGTSLAEQVSETLITYMSGEIELAQKGDAKPLTISDDASYIDFWNKNGNHVKISTVKPDSKAYLLEYYYPYTYRTVNGVDRNVEAVNWQFDERTYMDFYITDLSFERDGNVVIIKLSLTNDIYGTFENTKYIRLYNYGE